MRPALRSRRNQRDRATQARAGQARAAHAAKKGRAISEPAFFAACAPAALPPPPPVQRHRRRALMRHPRVRIVVCAVQHGLLCVPPPHVGAHHVLENVQNAHFHRRRPAEKGEMPAASSVPRIALSPLPRGRKGSQPRPGRQPVAGEQGSRPRVPARAPVAIPRTACTKGTRLRVSRWCQTATKPLCCCCKNAQRRRRCSQN